MRESAIGFEGPLGARVLREEAALATLALEDVFGFELLQVRGRGVTACTIFSMGRALSIRRSLAPELR